MGKGISPYKREKASSSSKWSSSLILIPGMSFLERLNIKSALEYTSIKSGRGEPKWPGRNLFTNLKF